MTLEPMIAIGHEGRGLAISPLSLIRAFSFGGHWISEVIDAIHAGGDVPWRLVALATMATLSFFVFHFLFSWILIGWVAYHQGMSALLKDPVALYSAATVIFGAVVVSLFYIIGNATYYFSDAAFFVALPMIVILATQQVDHWRMTSTTVLLFGIAMIIAPSLKCCYRANALSLVQPLRQQSPFIASLLRVRDRLPIDSVMKPAPSLLSENPVSHCSTQPFLFPAVSERPWIDVIPTRDDCRYYGFGYSQYGITDSQQSVTVPAQVLPGMTIHHWPPKS